MLSIAKYSWFHHTFRFSHGKFVSKRNNFLFTRSISRMKWSFCVSAFPISCVCFRTTRVYKHVYVHSIPNNRHKNVMKKFPLGSSVICSIQFNMTMMTKLIRIVAYVNITCAYRISAIRTMNGRTAVRAKRRITTRTNDSKYHRNIS